MMKIIKNLWSNRKLLGFTILNAILFTIINLIKFGLQSSFMWVLGYFLVESFLNQPYVSYINFFAYFFLLKISITILDSKKSK